jgi:hypothetical protein
VRIQTKQSRSFGEKARSSAGWHVHDCDQILIVTSGSGIVAAEHEQHEMKMADVAHIKAGERHGTTSLARSSAARHNGDRCRPGPQASVIRYPQRAKRHGHQGRSNQAGSHRVIQ